MTRQNPEWYDIALNEYGTHEIAGASHNRRIIEYHATTSLKATTDETPWCSAFVNWVMKQAGYKGTGSAAARSWLTYGVELQSPMLGCIVVLKRGNNPQSGHVCFYVEEVANNMIRCLGGNQGDQVKYSLYSKADVLSYRWPADVPAVG